MLHIGETYFEERSGEVPRAPHRIAALAKECNDAVDFSLRGGGVNLDPEESRIDAARVLLEKVEYHRDKARASLGPYRRRSS